LGEPFIENTLFYLKESSACNFKELTIPLFSWEPAVGFPSFSRRGSILPQVKSGVVIGICRLK